MKHFIRGKRIGCDTESTGLNTWTGDRPFAFSFFNKAGQKAYFEFPVDPVSREVLYSRKPKQFKKLQQFYTDASIEKVFHNAKHDIRMLEAAGIHGKGSNF
jgi:DNA polymerase I-like protein with 3'-5' exonuclease and polymerase domains